MGLLLDQNPELFLVHISLHLSNLCVHTSYFNFLVIQYIQSCDHLSFPSNGIERGWACTRRRVKPGSKDITSSFLKNGYEDVLRFYIFKWWFQTIVNNWDLQQGASMADVEKRKSFADMKLVDFTSGFSNFEVGRKDLNPTSLPRIYNP